MESPISNSTLGTLRDHIAVAQDPITGGVAVAAVSAGLAMALLAMTLEVASRRKKPNNLARLKELTDRANQESARLLRYADQDIAAYRKYLESLKSGRSINAVLRKIVETPLKAAEAAAAGLDLCMEAISLVPRSVVSDVGAAATLLAGTVKAILLTLDVNLRELPDGSKLRSDGIKKRRSLETRSTRLLERALRRRPLLS